MNYELYCYAENHSSKGRVYVGDDAEENYDLDFYGEGTREALIEQALASLAKRYDLRPGGASDSFRWKCDRNVLEYLGGPEVEFDETRRAFFPVAD